MKLQIIALTAGDVAGIGPEVIVRTLLDPKMTNTCRPVVICHPAIIKDAVSLLNLSAVDVVETVAPTSRMQLETVLTETTSQPRIVCWNPANDAVMSAPRRTDSPEAGHAAYEYLTAAIGLAQNRIVDAISTAPLNKAALHLAGHDFPGHTEILAARCDVSEFAMMLHLPESRLKPLRRLVRTSADEPYSTDHGLSIAHVTLHTSVKSVPSLLTTDGIAASVRLMHGFLSRIGCQRRRIAVSALNPHGGEGGLFGSEETDIIRPAVEQFEQTDVTVAGPLPVDTLMRRAVAGEFDGIVAMYHDQGHIPIKLMGFDAAVNITLGLPIVRTSPTHGTAFDRAWNAATPADPSGMIEAVLMAARLTP